MLSAVKYLVHSNAQIAVDLNPFQWRLFCFMYSPSPGRGVDANRRFIFLRLLMLKLSVAIDNGEAIFE